MLPFVTTGTDPEGVMLSDTSPMRKDKQHVISLIMAHETKKEAKQSEPRYRQQIGGHQKRGGWGRARWARGQMHDGRRERDGWWWARRSGQMLNYNAVHPECV